MVIPTGGGKTVVYAIPSIMKRGQSVVVSPLVMLMYDQMARFRQLGINTCHYNTLLSEEEKHLFCITWFKLNASMNLCSLVQRQF